MNTDQTKSCTAPLRSGKRCLAFVLATIAATLCMVGAASAAGWETAAIFAGSRSLPAEPGVWPEEVQLGGVTGIAVNVSGAGGVTPGTVYTAGFGGSVLWHVARYGPKADGGLEFELSWNRAGRCGPKAAEPAHPTCPSIPEGPTQAVDVEVDQATGNVYVFYGSAVDPGGVVKVYSPDGSELISQFAPPDIGGTIGATPKDWHGVIGTRAGIAVTDTGRVYISDEDGTFHHRLMIYEPQIPGNYTQYKYGGELLAGATSSSNAPEMPVVDGQGNIYTAGLESVQKFSPTGQPLCKFQQKTGGIQAMTVNPVTGEAFYYSYKDHKVRFLICNASGVFVPKPGLQPLFLEPQRGDLAALGFDPQRQLTERPQGVLYAGAPNECPSVGKCPEPGQSSLGYVAALSIGSPPEVISEGVATVGTTAATLTTRINPKGSETTYTFEYLTEAQYEVNPPAQRFTGALQAPIGGGLVGSGSVPLNVATTISGLTPDTEYRYRVVASSEEGRSDEGAGEVVAKFFRTFPSEAAVLPNGRAYELVSPAQKFGGQVMPADAIRGSCGNQCKPGVASRQYPVSVSADGDSIAYKGSPFSLTEGVSEFDEYVSRRSTSGWSTVGLSPPLAGDTGGRGFEAFGLNAQLNSALVYAKSLVPSPEAPPGYLNFFTEQTGDKFGLNPLLTESNASFHRSPGIGTASLVLHYAGHSSDFARQFFEANDALTGPTATAPKSQDGGASSFNLYEWSGGQLNLVNVLPGNAQTPSKASFGSGFLLPSSGLGAQVANFSHAISSDGSRVFWTAEGTGAQAGQLFVRVNNSETVKIPGPGNCKATVPLVERVCFLTASEDGSKVLLSNGQMYVLNTESGAYETGADLTAGTGGFEGISGQSEDLSHVYFVMGPTSGTGTLTEGSSAVASVVPVNRVFRVGQTIQGEGIPAGTKIVAVGAGTLQLSAASTASVSSGALRAQGLIAGSEPNSAGFAPSVSGINLYSWQGGSARFVTTLLENDNSEQGVWSTAPVKRGAEASPDGRWLAFSSKARLTGIDSNGACAGAAGESGALPCPEIFLYDSSTRTLRCSSCNPVGAPPLGQSALLVPRNAEAFLPQARFLTNSGRLYFDSADRLSVLDTNGAVEDIYQYEPNGVGTCVRAEGCVSLISTGQGEYDANLLTIDPTGGNVFFTTRNRLVSADRDDLIDLYDAREGGGFPEEGAPPGECQGEGCQSAQSPPVEPSPSSQTVPPAGNGKKPACKKNQVKRKGRCVKKPTKNKQHEAPSRSKQGGKK
ncbi:MAG TPA: hypothetical protein VMS11_01465 [Solirubrobacterales bacterium]|nr:hypothetical protein [Solirubrobacterales bacterium]